MNQKKCLRARRPSVIRYDGVQRCNVHSENKFVLAEGIKIAKHLKCMLTGVGLMCHLALIKNSHCVLCVRRKMDN